MADYGLPEIKIEFKAKAETFIQRSQNGIVGLILETEDSELIGMSVNCNKSKDIPENLDEINRSFILNALIGNYNKPYKIVVFFIDKTATTDRLAKAIEFFSVVKVNYLTTTIVLTEKEKQELYQAITLMREEDEKPIKFVVAKFKADHEAFINFTSTGMTDKFGKKYSTEEFTPRIAGLIAGTPVTIATTYSNLPEIVSIDKRSITECNNAIANGEFILFDNGDRTNNIVVGRGVNSLVTLRVGQNNQFKKIKIIETIDMMKEDIQTTLKRSWVGKYPNTYDYKILLISEIRDYNASLERQGVLDAGWTVDIDLEAQIAYLESIGAEITPEMSELDIKKMNTKDKVFIQGSIYINDAMEDIFYKVAV